MDFINLFIEATGVTTTALLLLLVAAFVAGFIDAIAGGGGLLTVPAFLAAGLPAHIALGTNKLASTFGSFTASLTFYKNKLFAPHFWRLSTYATAIGSIIGTWAVSKIDASVLDKVLPIFIGFSAIYALFNKVKQENQQSLPPVTKSLSKKQLSQGLTLGFYDGFAGPGTGAFWTVSNLYLYKMNLLMSSGLARTMNFISNFFSLLSFIYLGFVNFALGLTMGAFFMVGAYCGAHSAIKLGNKFIRPVFTIVVATMAIKLGFDAWM